MSTWDFNNNGKLDPNEKVLKDVYLSKNSEKPKSVYLKNNNVSDKRSSSSWLPCFILFVLLGGGLIEVFPVLGIILLILAAIVFFCR